MLAVVEALEHFKPMFEGHHVLIESDRRNLSFLRSCKDATGKLGRCMRLETFDNDLRYRAGKDQPVADCLSRNPIDKEIELDADGEPASAAYLVTSTHRTIEGELEQMLHSSCGRRVRG